MEHVQARPGWGSPSPSRPVSRASMKSKPNTPQHRYAAHHKHTRTVSSESHWLRFGTLEEIEPQETNTESSPPKPPRFTRSGGCLQLFNVVGYKLKRGKLGKVLGRGSDEKSEKERS